MKRIILLVSLIFTESILAGYLPPRAPMVMPQPQMQPSSVPMPSTSPMPPAPMVLPTSQYHPLAQVFKQTFDSAEFRINLKNVLIQQIKKLSLTPEEKEQAKRLLFLLQEGLSINWSEYQKAQQTYWQAVETVAKPFDEQLNKLYTQQQNVMMPEQPEQQIMTQNPTPMPPTPAAPAKITEQGQFKNQLETIAQQMQQAIEAVPLPPIIQKVNALTKKLMSEAQPFIASLTEVFGSGEQAMQYWSTFGKEIIEAMIRAIQEMK